MEDQLAKQDNLFQVEDILGVNKRQFLTTIGVNHFQGSTQTTFSLPLGKRFPSAWEKIPIGTGNNSQQDETFFSSAYFAESIRHCLEKPLSDSNASFYKRDLTPIALEILPP